MDEPSVERWRRIESLLDAALDLPEAARHAFLEGAAEQADLRAEALRILRAQAQMDRFMESPAAEFAAPLLAHGAEEDDAGAPVRVGPYRVLREAGHGGMATVFLAERDDPHLTQRVALKLVRGGVMLPSLMRRFLEERQILASLEHPNIARLLDGGVTDDGVPWFAMEYVEGVPIDRYCERNDLDVPARLRLFLDVCDAVQFAHRNLVVHRDLKPSNILVTGEGRVKLLDFGIATLLAGSEGGGSGEPTAEGWRPLTPGYASPEQVRGQVVSTASDVYSLGVLLYTLLAARHPFHAPEGSPHLLLRAILEGEVERPSTVADKGLGRRLRGDLDAIVLTAMRREPERRYGSAEQLAADVTRHLAGQPVNARPDGWRYRTGKFIRRHPAGVAAACAFTLLLGGYVITIQAHSEQVAREAARTEQVKDLLLGIFTEANPGVARGRELSASELVEQGALRVAAELAEQPDLQAEMMTTLGVVLGTLGRYHAAIELLESALETQRRLHPRPHPTVARAAQLLADVLHYEGRLAEAESLMREVLETHRHLHGESDWRVGIVLTDLGDLLHSRGELDEAEVHLRGALRILVAEWGEEHPDVARARRDLANVLRDGGAFGEAEALYRQALRSLEAALGTDEPMGALTRNELARLLAETGGHGEAERLLGDNRSLYAALYPDGHPIQGTTMRNMGVLRLRQGRPGEAAAALEEALDLYDRTLPPAHALIPRTLRHLAQAQLDLGDTAAAARTAEEAFQRLQAGGLAGHRAARDAAGTLAAARQATPDSADLGVP